MSSSPPPPPRKSTRIKNLVIKIDPARVVTLLVELYGTSKEAPSFEDRKLCEKIQQLMAKPKFLLPDEMDPEKVAYQSRWKAVQAVVENSPKNNILSGTDDQPIEVENSNKKNPDTILCDDSSKSIEPVKPGSPPEPESQPEPESLDDNNCDIYSDGPPSPCSQSEPIIPSVEEPILLEPTNTHNQESSKPESSLQPESSSSQPKSSQPKSNRKRKFLSDPTETPNGEIVLLDPVESDHSDHDPKDTEFEPIPESRTRDLKKSQTLKTIEKAYRTWTRQPLDPSVPLQVHNFSKECNTTITKKILGKTRTTKYCDHMKISGVVKRFPQLNTVMLYRFHRSLQNGEPILAQVMEQVEEYIHDRFKEEFAKGTVVHDKNIQDWAMEAKAKYDPEEKVLSKFKASNTWVLKFKEKFGIRLKELYPLKVLYPRTPGSRHFRKEEKERLEREKATIESRVAVSTIEQQMNPVDSNQDSHEILEQEELDLSHFQDSSQLQSSSSFQTLNAYQQFSLIQNAPMLNDSNQMVYQMNPNQSSVYSVFHPETSSSFYQTINEDHLN